MRQRLLLEPLETRTVPAGIVTSAFAGGVLTLTGDDAANDVTIKISGGNITLTPDGTTAIDGLAVGTPKIIAGTPTSLKASLGNGADFLAVDGATDFLLPGSATIDLGSGNNTLSFATTLKLELGSLSVKARDGNDIIALDAGAGLGQIAGNITCDVGDGPGTLQLSDCTVSGSLTLKGKATGGSALGVALVATNSQVTKGTVLGSVGGAQGLFNNCTFGSITMTGYLTNVTPTNTTINGAVKLNGQYANILSLDSTTINGNLTAKTTLDASALVWEWQGTNVINGSVTMNTKADIIVDGQDSLTINGNLSLTGIQKLTIEHQGDVTINGNCKFANKAIIEWLVSGTAADNVTITGQTTLNTPYSIDATFNDVALTMNKVNLNAGAVSFNLTNLSTTINGDWQVKASLAFFILVETTNLSKVLGNVTMTGGWFSDTLDIARSWQASKNVTLNLKDGANDVEIGTLTGAVSILGNLAITTGKDDDTISFVNTNVIGSTSIKTGASTDTVLARLTSTFGGPFTADLGAGDDRLEFAQTNGGATPVIFNGVVNIKTGADNDTLLLGVAGGDAGQAVSFVGGGHKIDGGTGLNTFDDNLADFTGIVLGTGILNWTDPTP